MQDSLAETQAPRSLPPHENESKLGHSKNHRAAVEPHVFGEMVLGTQSFTSDFQGVQNAWMCPSAGPPGGQNVTGIPATKSCPKVGATGFPQACAYLLDKSPGEEKSDTHRGTVSTAVCCGAERNRRKPMEEDSEKKF